jgi:hypothetical protein
MALGSRIFSSAWTGSNSVTTYKGVKFSSMGSTVRNQIWNTCILIAIQIPCGANGELTQTLVPFGDG